MKKEIRVWDPLVRVFHWTLVLSFAIAWASADALDTLHFWAGYTIAALVAFRIVWGVIGTRHARFSDFVYHLSTIKSYLVDLAALRPKPYVGHNPAGGLMVIVLLLSWITHLYRHGFCITRWYWATCRHLGSVDFRALDGRCS